MVPSTLRRPVIIIAATAIAAMAGVEMEMTNGSEMPSENVEIEQTTNTTTKFENLLP